MSSFVITTSIRGATKTEVWEGHEPLKLGHPFRWILERTPEGIRCRDLSLAPGQVQTGGVKELTHLELEKGPEIELAPYRLKFKPVRSIPAPFEANLGGSTLVVYQCIDRWVNQTIQAQSHYLAKVRGIQAFEVSKTGANYVIQAKKEAISLFAAGNSKILKSQEKIELTPAELARTTLAMAPISDEKGTLKKHPIAVRWRFGFTEASAIPSFSDGPQVSSAIENNDSLAFKKAVRATLIGSAVFLALCIFWPHAKEDPHVLIPEQYTKIVLSAQPKQQAAPTSVEAGAPSVVTPNTPKKVQEAAVVQAFRAKALSNAVNGLLKGGMSKLLAQSDFVAGSTKNSEARRIFDTKSTTLRASAPASGLGEKTLQVAALGGDAKGIAGSNVGYGKGERAAIKGQGQGFTPFVAADMSGAIVDEGLTKDEVGEIIHKHLSEVRYCYESAMIHTPDIEGKLMTNFAINAAGIVKTADVKSSTLPDPRLDDCIIRRLMTWKFPKPRGGVDVAVTYPFIFKTLGR